MQWRGFGMDLGTKFFQGGEMEGGHFGQVRTLRGVILDKIGDWGGVIWTSEEIEGGGLILDKWRDWGDHGHMYIRNFLLTIDIEGDHLSLPCPYLVCVKGVGQGWSKEIQGRHVEHMMWLRGSFWENEDINPLQPITIPWFRYPIFLKQQKICEMLQK